MKIKSTLLLLAAGWIGAYAYRRTRDRVPMLETGNEPYTEDADAPLALASASGDWPNAANSVTRSAGPPLQ